MIRKVIHLDELLYCDKGGNSLKEMTNVIREVIHYCNKGR